MNSNIRACAAMACADVFAGSNLDVALERVSVAFSPADRALLSAIVYGTLREWRALEWIAGQLLQQPLRNEPVAQALLLCGLHQLRAMRVPAHAAVSETVAAATQLNKAWAKGLINAVLRRFQREQATIESTLPPDAAIRLSYPDWLVTAVKRDWPNEWRTTLAAGNEQGPLTLRMNARRTDREAYREQLASAGITAATILETPCALRLSDALPVDQIPGFADGQVSVQDAAAQLAADLLDVKPGQRVLDACAAPGGKCAHLLERPNQLDRKLDLGLDLTALDIDPARLQRVQGNLDRLGLQATLIAGHAARPSEWWDDRRFDRILLDAPCSGTGVIRRHPDIKWLRRESDIAALAEQQRRLLRALWPLLAPGGQLLYATCSILRAEGEEVVGGFLETQQDARELPIEATWGEACRVGRRLPPGSDFDGFYYARLLKDAMPDAI